MFSIQLVRNSLAGWVRNLTKIISNGFPKAVGDGFWPSRGGFLGHLGSLGEGFWVTLGALGRAFGSPYCPKAPRTETDTKSVKVGRSLGYPKEPQNDSFPMKTTETGWVQGRNHFVNECCKKYYFLKDFVSILMPFVRAWKWKKQWKLCNRMQI